MTLSIPYSFSLGLCIPFLVYLVIKTPKIISGIKPVKDINDDAALHDLVAALSTEEMPVQLTGQGLCFQIQKAIDNEFLSAVVVRELENLGFTVLLDNQSSSVTGCFYPPTEGVYAKLPSMSFTVQPKPAH